MANIFEGVTWCKTCQLQWAYSKTRFGILHLKNDSCHCLPKTSLYFTCPIGRSMSSFVDKTMEGILHSLISYCFNICISLHRADISDFLQSQLAKLQQHRLTKETTSVQMITEQRNVKFLFPGFYFKNNHSITNHGMCHWWQLQAAKHIWMHSWSVIVQVMTPLSPFTHWDFFHFWRNRGIPFFPKMSTALVQNKIIRMYLLTLAKRCS